MCNVKLEDMQIGSLVIVRGSWGSGPEVLARVDCLEENVKNDKPGLDYTEVISGDQHWAYLDQVERVVRKDTPNAKDIADFMVKQAIENSESGSWIVYRDELEEQFGIIDDEYNIELIRAIENELNTREELAEVESSLECFDMIFYLNFLENYDAQMNEE